VPVPGLGLLSYRSRPRAPPKARASGALGRRTVVGCRRRYRGACRRRRRAARRLAGARRRAVPAAAVVDLALWVGDYYASGPGDAARDRDAAGSRVRGEAIVVRDATLVEWCEAPPS
jgi:hypothetical protein